MCENPIYIRNNTKKFNSMLTKVGFHVPCGKCPSCVAAMRDEWFLRAFAEYQEFKEKGGRVFFPTNTYDTKSLPVFNPKTGRLRHGDDKEGIKCFSKRDVQAYLKKLRKKFENLGIIGIKYLVCSEYGMSENGTHRPHYHCLIYIPQCDLTTSAIENILDDSWNFGFTFFSEKGSEVNSINAILYVSKYCTKQFDFYENEELNDYMSNLAQKEKIKEYLPKRYNSKYFGIHLAKWLECKDNIEDFIQDGVSDNYLGLSNEGKTYAIPRYIRNKILYTTDEYGLRKPTERGHEILMKLYETRVRKAEQSMSKNFTVQGLRAKIDDEDAHNVIKTIEKYEYDNSLKGLCDFLHDKINNRSLRELAIYKVAFRNTMVDDEFCLQELSNYNVDELLVVGYALLDESFDQLHYDVYEKSVKELGLIDDVCVWNGAPRFEDFDIILDVIQRINSLASKRRQRKKVEDEKIITKLKNLL